MVFRTVAYEALGDLFLLVHGPTDPDPQDWEALMKEARNYRLPKHLVLAGEVRLTPAQRVDVVEYLHFPCKAAVMLSSPLTRSMVTAIGWLTSKHRAFLMTDLEGALQYLDIAPERLDEINHRIVELQRTLRAQA
jgi:hypothetical protein